MNPTNTPNPLVPQGSLQQHQAHGKSTIRIAVLTIIALHAAFFTGLLIQGCRPDAERSAGKTSGTPNPTNEVSKLGTNADFYASSRELPSVPTSPPPATNEPTQPAPAPALTTPATPAPAEVPPQTKEYTIVRGDSLYKIAKAHGVTLPALNKANAGLEPNRLKIGQKIQIPASAPAAAGLGVAEPGQPEGATNVHVVKAGETLNKIARHYGTTEKALKAANNLKTDRILVGQKLKLPAGQKPAAPTVGAGSTTTGTSAPASGTNVLSSLPSGSPVSNPP